MFVWILDLFEALIFAQLIRKFPRFGVRIPVGARYLLFSRTVQTGSGPHVVSLFNGYRSYFPGLNGPGREFGLLPVFSADVKNECSYSVPQLLQNIFMARTAKIYPPPFFQGTQNYEHVCKIALMCPILIQMNPVRTLVNCFDKILNFNVIPPICTKVFQVISSVVIVPLKSCHAFPNPSAATSSSLACDNPNKSKVQQLYYSQLYKYQLDATFPVYLVFL